MINSTPLGNSFRDTYFQGIDFRLLYRVCGATVHASRGESIMTSPLELRPDLIVGN